MVGLAILVIGASGMSAQILLLRELLVSFYGNELTVGIILGNWLIAEALGAWWGGRGQGREVERFVIAQILFAFFLITSLYLSRGVKVMAGPPGLGFGIGAALLHSLWILFLPGFTHGALFPLASKILAERRTPVRSIGEVYVLETVGTILGGIGIAYLLIPYFDTFELALAISLLDGLICVGISLSLGRRGLLFPSAATSALLAIFLAAGGASILHQRSLALCWKGQEVVRYQNSIYSNLVVVKRGKEYTFFSDGQPALTTPNPDPYLTELFAHIPLALHPAPERVLVISGGAGGLIREILKHPVRELDYVELDPTLIQLLKEFPTPLTLQELGDERVRVWPRDGRHFLRERKGREYDVVLLGIGPPSDLQTNRLFTSEFFKMVKERMGQKGILALHLPGSLVYIGREMAALHRTLASTLKEAFGWVKVVPGEETFFLASPSSLEVSPQLLWRRLKERGVRSDLLTQPLLAYLLEKGREAWYWKMIGGEGVVNRDFHPIGILRYLAYWNALYSPSLRTLFVEVQGLDLKTSFLALPLILLLLSPLSFLKGGFRRTVAVAIAFTGLWGMVMELVLLYAFQVVYGYIYYWVGLLITAFMAGVGLGGLLGMRGGGLRTFIVLELILLLWALGLPSVLERWGEEIRLLFPLLAFGSGGLLGAQFPLASSLYLRGRGEVGETAGTLYAMDLLGGWVAGVIAGVILLPLLGFRESGWLTSALKAISLLLVLMAAFRRKG